MMPEQTALFSLYHYNSMAKHERMQTSDHGGIRWSKFTVEFELLCLHSMEVYVNIQLERSDFLILSNSPHPRLLTIMMKNNYLNII